MEPALDPTIVFWLTLLFGLFLIVLIVLWIILPFAVFGVKSRLDAVLISQRYILDETKIQNELIAEQSKILAALLKDVREQTKDG